MRVPTLQLDVDRAALLAIHWQVDAVLPNKAFGVHFAEAVKAWGTLERTAALFAAARERHLPIVHVRVVFERDDPTLIQNCYLFRHVAETGAFLRGGPGAQFVDELAPTDREVVVDHSRISCFFGTDLDVVLRRVGATSLLLTGVATNVAVEGTAREAVDLDYDVTVVGDCCATASKDVHDASLRRMAPLVGRVLDAEQLIGALSGSTA